MNFPFIDWLAGRGGDNAPDVEYHVIGRYASTSGYRAQCGGRGEEMFSRDILVLYTL